MNARQRSAELNIGPVLHDWSGPCNQEDRAAEADREDYDELRTDRKAQAAEKHRAVPLVDETNPSEAMVTRSSGRFVAKPSPTRFRAQNGVLYVWPVTQERSTCKAGGCGLAVQLRIKEA
jgi:hypothetical protein